MMVLGLDQSVDGRLWRPVQDPDGNRGYVPVEYLVTYVSPTPAPTGTATPTRTPAPRNTPTPKVGLAEAERAVLWISLSNDSYLGVLEVFAQPSFEVPSLGLSVFVEGIEFCNLHALYPDEAPLQLDCGFEQWAHGSIQNVNARTDDARFRCVRHVASTNQRSLFACDPR